MILNGHKSAALHFKKIPWNVETYSRMSYRVQDDSEFGNHMIVGINASVLNVQSNLRFDSKKLILMVYGLSIS